MLTYSGRYKGERTVLIQNRRALVGSALEQHREEAAQPVLGVEGRFALDVDQFQAKCTRISVLTPACVFATFQLALPSSLRTLHRSCADHASYTRSFYKRSVRGRRVRSNPLWDSACTHLLIGVFGLRKHSSTAVACGRSPSMRVSITEVT